MRRSSIALLAVLALALVSRAASDPTAPTTVRVAVIGGMTDTGFWQALAERYEKAGGQRIEIVSTGPKQVIADAFKQGKADLITMHASDTIINLVADGYALDPQPWLKNDLVIVGPKSDAAGIHGQTDAAADLKKIKASGSSLVVHASLGAQEVLRDILDSAGLPLDPEKTTLLFSDKARQVLKIAAEKNAYTLVGRIPFLGGKLPNEGLVLMVQGDPKLRRPYLVAVADPAHFASANAVAARQLAQFLRQEETQRWIAEYGKGKLDDQPIFFRVGSERDRRPSP